MTPEHAAARLRLGTAALVGLTLLSVAVSAVVRVLPL